MLQLVDVVKDNLLKENMQLEVLYTIAKKADCPVNYLRLDIEKDVIDAEFGKCANFFVCILMKIQQDIPMIWFGK